MASNQIRDNKAEEEKKEQKIIPEKQNDQTERGFFNLFFSSEAFTQESVIRNFPFIIFMVMIGMVYISNRHFSEKNVRDIEKTNRELKEMRSEYMSTQEELMYRSKQTEVAKRVEEIGLKESIVPPQKIVLPAKK